MYVCMYVCMYACMLTNCRESCRGLQPATGRPTQGRPKEREKREKERPEDWKRERERERERKRERPHTWQHSKAPFDEEQEAQEVVEAQVNREGQSSKFSMHELVAACKAKRNHSKTAIEDRRTHDEPINRKAEPVSVNSSRSKKSYG